MKNTENYNNYKTFRMKRSSTTGGIKKTPDKLGDTLPALSEHKKSIIKPQHSLMTKLL